jgi:hypothetical protein
LVIAKEVGRIVSEYYTMDNVLKLPLIINMSGYFGLWVPCRSPADRSWFGIRVRERVSAMKDLGMDIGKVSARWI